MTQTAYAAARSRDPRNQIFGVQERFVVNPLQMQRPSPTSGGGISNPAAMYSAPSQTMLGGGQMTPPDVSVNNNVQNLAAQAAQDQQAMVNPSMMQRAQELLAQNQQQAPGAIQGNGSLSGIDIGAPQPAQPNADLSTEQGLENAGLMPSLPVTPPAPLSKEDKTFTTDQVDNSKATVNNLFQANAPQGGVRGATAAKDQDRINNDIQKIAESKNPHQTWQNIQKEPFYQNSSFYTGLMGVGLSIMSGKDPLEAFQIGSSMADQDDMKKQLGGNRDALLDQGYSADSVANAIAQGDPRLLKMRELSPEANAQMQDEREQSRYDRNRADQLTDQETAAQAADRRGQINQQYALDQINARAKVQEALAQTKADLKVTNTSPKWTPSEELGGITPNFRDKLQSSFRPVMTVISQRNKWMAPVEAAMSQLEAGGDKQTQAAAQRAATENLTKLVQGGIASIGKHTMDELTGDPNWTEKNLNKLSLMAGQGPTKENIKWLKALGDQVMKIDKAATIQQIGPLTDSLIADSGLPRPNALRAANSVFAPAGVRMTEDDYIDWAKDHSKIYKETQDINKRSGGALSTDPSWMTQ